MEYAEHGSLRHEKCKNDSFSRICLIRCQFRTYLRASRGLRDSGQHGQPLPPPPPPPPVEVPARPPPPPPSPRDILSFAWQIAKGMEYINNMKVQCRPAAADVPSQCRFADLHLQFWNGETPAAGPLAISDALWLSPSHL